MDDISYLHQLYSQKQTLLAEEDAWPHSFFIPGQSSTVISENKKIKTQLNQNNIVLITGKAGTEKGFVCKKIVEFEQERIEKDIELLEINFWADTFHKNFEKLQKATTRASGQQNVLIILKNLRIEQRKQTHDIFNLLQVIKTFYDHSDCDYEYRYKKIIIDAHEQDLKELRIHFQFFLEIKIPELKDRREDLHCSIREILLQLSQTLTDDEIQFFSKQYSQYDWPYNHDELSLYLKKFLLNRQTTVLSHQKIERLPYIDMALQSIDLKNYLERMEENLIVQALSLADQNKTRAAEGLGINRTTLIEKMKKYQLTSFLAEKI